jgi:hypothetical protein
MHTLGLQLSHCRHTQGVAHPPTQTHLQNLTLTTSLLPINEEVKEDCSMPACDEQASQYDDTQTRNEMQQ